MKIRGSDPLKFLDRPFMKMRRIIMKVVKDETFVGGGQSDEPPGF